MNCQAENIIVVSKVKSLFMCLLIVNDPYGCSMKYNLIWLSVENIVTSIVTVIPIKIKIL